MNLIIIDKCSNSCPYCFASHEMDNIATNKMSRESLDVVLRYLKKDKTSQIINIIGGEPFLYDDLNFLINKLNESQKVKSYTVFTGGVFKPEKLQELKPFHRKLSLLFNVNEKQDYKSLKQYELVHQNIVDAIQFGIPTSIGFNIFRKDFNYEEIVNYCQEYGIATLRLAIAKPTFGIKNSKLLVPDDLGLISQRMVDFIEQASKLNVRIEMDCMLPKCFFSNEQLGRVSLLQPSIINYIGKCTLAFDISPDLSIFRCFAVSTENRLKLTDFETLKEAYDYLKLFWDERYLTPNIFGKCMQCEFAKNQSCWGDCLSYQSSFPFDNTYDNIVERIYSSLESDELDNISDLFNKLSTQNASYNLLRAYYYLKIGDLDNAKYFARKTINSTANKTLSKSACKVLENIR